MIDNIDLDLLRFMTVKDNYDMYHRVITKGMCTRESWTLLGDMGTYYKQYPEQQEIDETFKLWFRVTGHPAWKDEQHAIYNTVIGNVLSRQIPASSGPFRDQLDRLRFFLASAGEEDNRISVLSSRTPEEFGEKRGRQSRLGSHLGKGDYGAIEVVVAIVDPPKTPAKVKAVKIQRDRERYRSALRSATFLNQFKGKQAKSKLRVGDDIKSAHPGAVKASKVVALSVKKLLVAYEELNIANR